MVSKIAAGLVLGALAIYGGIEAYPLIAGPSLSLASPLEGQVVQNGVVSIAGQATRATSLTLNGAPLLPDEKGAFSTTLAFAAGTSILTLTAVDRFGRDVTITRNMYVPE